DEPVLRLPDFNERDVSDKPKYVQAIPRLQPADIAALDADRLNQWRTLLAVDQAVQRIYDALRRAGKLDDTVLIFLTDNGYPFGEHRGTTKRCPWEECIHTPLLVRYPWHRNATSDQLVSVVDLAPTVAQLAGVELPVTPDGRSLVPLLDGRDTDWRDAVL